MREGSSGQGPGDPGAVHVDGRGRTVLVVGDDSELAVALRDRLDRTFVTVCEVRTAEAAAAFGACRPWPWMVIGEGDGIPAPVVTGVADNPTLLLWRGSVPAGLPGHARGLALFSEVARSVDDALNAEVAGIRLAPGAGLTMPHGEHAGNAALEALVASHPHPLFAASRHFRSVDSTLVAHGVPLRMVRAASGGTSLAAIGGT